MSVLIDMEMPTSCYDCDFAYQDQDSDHNVYWTCAAVHKAACMYERRDDCPLVPVPPHGRLGDLDRIERILLEWESVVWDRNAMQMLRDCINLVKAAPTIIEAEEGET